MSEDAQTTTSNNDALQRKLEALESATAGLEAAMASARNGRLILLMLLVIFIALTIKSYVGMVMDFQSEANMRVLAQKASEKLAENTDTFQAEVQALLDNASPKITEAFLAQSKKDMPLYAGAIDRERDALIKNLQVELEKQVQKRQEIISKEFEQIIADEFPAAKDRESHRKMADNIQIALNQLVKRYYVDEFESQLKEMYSLYDDFPIADAVNAGEAPHEDQLLGELLELATLKLSRRSQMNQP